MIQRLFLRQRAAALVLALSLVPLAAGAQTSIKPGWNLFSPEQDVQIGQQSAQAAEQQLPILRDTQVDSYVNRIGQRLAARAGGPGFHYQFRVVNASDINAFALPGGYVYVNRGVLDQARNEGEVAGVLAHEIAHVALRHGTHQASKAYAAQAGISILGGLLGGHVGQGTAQVLNAVGGIGLNALFLKYSRDLESQADVRGAQILAASGYSPQDMVNFFTTLERVDQSRKTNWLSDHPAPPDRIARIQQEARSLHVASAPATNAASLRQVQARLRTHGSAPTSAQIAQGMTSSQPSTATRRRTGGGQIAIAAPSGSYAWATAGSRTYRVPYPSNWRVYQQGSTGMTIAPEGAVVDAGGRTDVVYGAIINQYNPFNNAASSLRSGNGNLTMEQATEDIVQQVRQGGPYLRVMQGSAQRVRVKDGGQALAETLRGVDPSTGLAERVTVVTRQLGSSQLVYLLLVTPEKDAARFGNVLQTMVSSMQVAR